jgi:predicted nucleotidyltransferase component of viral defense system
MEHRRPGENTFPFLGGGPMILTPQDLATAVAATGFGAEPLEKVIRLMSLLGALASHPFLKSRIVLKGGTALNLFHFEVPRLSVDIDPNYIGAVDRDSMLAERPKVEQAMQAVCSREGFTVLAFIKHSYQAPRHNCHRIPIGEEGR